MEKEFPIMANYDSRVENYFKNKSIYIASSNIILMRCYLFTLADNKIPAGNKKDYQVHKKFDKIIPINLKKTNLHEIDFKPGYCYYFTDSEFMKLAYKDTKALVGVGEFVPNCTFKNYYSARLTRTTNRCYFIIDSNTNDKDFVDFAYDYLKQAIISTGLVDCTHSMNTKFVTEDETRIKSAIFLGDSGRVSVEYRNGKTEMVKADDLLIIESHMKYLISKAKSQDAAKVFMVKHIPNLYIG